MKIGLCLIGLDLSEIISNKCSLLPIVFLELSMEYIRVKTYESAKRSRLAHSGFLGLKVMNLLNKM